MKKIFFLLLPFLIVSQSFAAHLGLTAGYNSSKWNDSDVASGNGFNAGAKVESDFSSPFYIELSLLYADQNIEINDNSKFEISHKVTSHNLKLPLDLGYKFTVNHNFQFAPKFGAYANYVVSGKDKVNDCSPVVKKIFDGKNPYSDFEDVTSDFNNFNRFGFGLEAGINFWFASKFELSAGYDFGLSDVWDNEIIENTKIRNLFINFAFLF